ncbi:DNA adenine methylase [Selenomonas montiformis]|uniref:DNA adenine methylase n=1 Tax=Selenomonas montiformis TaxID=2652285 RepID=UPI003F8CC41B
MPSTNTPLRYPGGKSQLTEFVYHTIQLNSIHDTIYCEPFSGGAGVAMSLLLENRVSSVILNDLDTAIYSIWHAILKDTGRLLNAIENINVSMETWHQQRQIYDKLRDSEDYSFELAFAAFFLNRTNRSGIVTGGPIGGMEQTGKYLVDCRFNKRTLSSKIRKIADNRARIELHHLDAVDLIRDVLLHQPADRLFTFFDPPYYQQGKNLYNNAFDDENHKELAMSIQTFHDHHWIVTYDNTPEIEEIYGTNYETMRYTLQYMATQKRREQELFFHSPITTVESFDKVIFED